MQRHCFIPDGANSSICSERRVRISCNQPRRQCLIGALAETWSEKEIVQQAVGQLACSTIRHQNICEDEIVRFKNATTEECVAQTSLFANI
jgi:hypothetical protein